MTGTIRVGIVGANAEGGWAQDSHVPAVQRLSGLEFAAVATSNQHTADKAAAAFGVAKAYPSGLDLIRDPEIDLVTVATRVPNHRELVLAALAAGKHVYCEWPLGRSIGEAEEMAQAAQDAEVRTAIGLQLRASPATSKARSLIASGAIGRLLSMSVTSATAGFGPVVPAPFVYLEDPTNFANLVTIQGAHTLDLAIALAGSLRNLSALATTQYPMIEAGDDHASRIRVTFDHLLVQARAMSGSSVAIAVAGGRPPEAPFWLEAVGEHGVLRMEGGAARGAQAGRMRVLVDDVEVAIDEGELAGMPEAAVNVAATYSALRDDIVHHTANAVGFDHAVRLTRLVEDTFAASRDGRRVTSNDWPT